MTAKLGVPDHDEPIVAVRRAQPVVLDILDTLADIVLTEDKRGILGNRYQAEAQWSAEL